MKCPTPGCRGRLACCSTRESDRAGRTLRYRKCPRCGTNFPTLETVLSINPIPTRTEPAQGNK